MRISAALGLIAAAFLPSAANAFGGGKGTSSSPTEPLVARSSRRDFLATGATVGAGVVTSGVITSPPFGSGEAIATAAPSSAALRGAISLPPIGLGAWAWGDSIFWGYDKKNDGDLAEVFSICTKFISPTHGPMRNTGTAWQWHTRRDWSRQSE